MDTQRAVEELEGAGIESEHAKHIVKVMSTAIEERPSIDRLDRMFAELRGEFQKEIAGFRAEIHQELAGFRTEIHKELHAFKFQMMWFFFATLIGILINILMTFWKH
ncbi:MAG: hypothetical protein JO015_19795 [Verrucomicrobia bacterium]|nr:hypothetical protein [Verrucomicrobiota bacterium]